MHSIETENTREAIEMRKVRNQTSNPSLLFARGVESLVADHMERPRYVEEDRTALKQAAVAKHETRGNFFTLLMRQFASQ